MIPETSLALLPTQKLSRLEKKSSRITLLILIYTSLTSGHQKTGKQFDAVKKETQMMHMLSNFIHVHCQSWLKLGSHIWHRFILPLPSPFLMVKNDFLLWLKSNFRNGFGCWNLTHHLIRQSRSFFKQKMGCRTLKWVPTSHPKLGVFFLFSKIHLHCCFYISAHTEARAIIFIWGDRYPPVHYEYKVAYGGCMVDAILAE